MTTPAHPTRPAKQTATDLLRARLLKAGIEPEALAALVWSIRPARMMTGDDIEVLADRVASKFSVQMNQMLRILVYKAVEDQGKNDRREILDELRGLVRMELEQLIVELGTGIRRSRDEVPLPNSSANPA